jgi:hypothetical protein
MPHIAGQEQSFGRTPCVLEALPVRGRVGDPQVRGVEDLRPLTSKACV